MSQPLFDVIHEIDQRVMQAPHLLLCVDYDGTLTHFAATPLGAHLTPQMDRVLESLAEHDNTSLAIVSGRDRADLQSRVGIPGAIYAGNHGLEISGPGYMFVEPMAAKNVGALNELAEQLRAKMEPIHGALVENKGLTISVHFRQVAAEEVEEMRRLVHATLASATHPFVLSLGEKVFEIRPRVYWNKGNAVGWIKDKLGKPEVLAIYLGDDVTDEDAFTAMTDGITIKVGEAETAAHYKLGCTAEVRKFLEWLDDLLRHKAQKLAEATAHPAEDVAVLR